MAICIGNIPVKNYYNLVILLKVTIKNVAAVFFDTQCIKQFQH